MRNARYIPVKIGKILYSKRWAYYLIAVVQVIAFASGSTVVSANTDCTDPTACTNQDDLYSINSNTPFYDPTDTVCSAQATPASNATGSAVIVPAGQNTGTWQSGLQPPYILEQFMIELLKDIAQKRGVPATDAVTQQHVIALIAFAWGEGGGMHADAKYFWNPFNTGPDFPELIEGTYSGSGLEGFKNFDDGVEATARVMTGDMQGRLGVTLTEPNSTAIDFINSLLDFTPLSTGHHPWAEASDPSSKYYESNYKAVRLQLVAQATSNYDDMASTIMRGETSDPVDQHDTSKLRFRTSGASSSGGGATAVDASLNTSSCSNTTSSTGGSFFQLVKKYAWPTYHEGPYCIMMPDYAAAVEKALPAVKAGKDYVGGGNDTLPSGADCFASTGRAGIDCGGFVTRVYRDSGADPNYNSGVGGVTQQYAYVTSHPNLYKRVSPQPTKSGDLQAGDIYFEQDLGHTYLYVGQGIFPDPSYNSVSASVSYSLYGQSWRTPMASPGDNDIAGGIWYRPLFSLGATTAATTLAT